jgi:hypothetical protein
MHYSEICLNCYNYGPTAFSGIFHIFNIRSNVLTVQRRR